MILSPVADLLTLGGTLTGCSRSRSRAISFRPARNANDKPIITPARITIPMIHPNAFLISVPLVSVEFAPDGVPSRDGFRGVRPTRCLHPAVEADRWRASDWGDLRVRSGLRSLRP